MNEELINYIRENLAKGVAEDQIRQTLLNNGWQQADIDAALVHLQSSQANVSPSQLGNSKPSRPTSLKIFIIVDVIFYSLVFAGLTYFFLFQSYFPKSFDYFLVGTIAIIAIWFYITDIFLWLGKKWALGSRTAFNILNAGGVGIGLFILIIVAAFLARAEIREYLGLPTRSKRFSNLVFIAIILGVFAFITIAGFGLSKFLGSNKDREKPADPGNKRYEQITQIGKALIEYKNNNGSYPKNLSQLNLENALAVEDFTYKNCNRIDVIEKIVYIKLTNGSWLIYVPSEAARYPQNPQEEPTCQSTFGEIDITKISIPDYPKGQSKTGGKKSASAFADPSKTKQVEGTILEYEYDITAEDDKSGNPINFYSQYADEYKINGVGFWTNKSTTENQVYDNIAKTWIKGWPTGLTACNSEFRLILYVNTNIATNSESKLRVGISPEKLAFEASQSKCKDVFVNISI